MSENLQKRPVKGILKNSSSFDTQESQPVEKRRSINRRKSKETKWDEMNIIATLHPPDKDYGHMKIDEPKTPYNYRDADDVDGLDAEELAERIRLSADKPPKFLDEDSDDSDEEMTEEEKAHKREFELRRKKHYNEFQALQLAKKLLEEEEDDDNSDEQGASSKPN